jgi:hypothetical protein
MGHKIQHLLIYSSCSTYQVDLKKNYRKVKILYSYEFIRTNIVCYVGLFYAWQNIFIGALLAASVILVYTSIGNLSV